MRMSSTLGSVVARLTCEFRRSPGSIREKNEFRNGDRANPPSSISILNRADGLSATTFTRLYSGAFATPFLYFAVAVPFGEDHVSLARKLEKAEEEWEESGRLDVGKSEESEVVRE